MSSEWDKTLLGELIKHKKGFAFKSKDYIDAGTPVIRVSNFTDDSISPSDLKFVDQSVAALNKDVELQEYDIVIATVGSWPNNPASVVGRSISVPSWASGALMNQNAVVLRAKTNNPVDQRFLYFQTKSDEFSRHVVSKAQGSANQASITLDAIFSFPIFWPEYFARKEISNFLSAIDDRINLLRETNATLEAIAQALFKSWFVDFDPVHANAGTQAPSLPPEIQALFPSTFTDSPQGSIPEGWEWSTIAQSFILTMGQSPPGDTYNETGEGLPFYQGRTDYGFRFPSQRVFCTSPTRLAKRGDSLVSVRAPVGDVNIALENCALGRGVAGVRHPRDCNSFVFYALKLLKPHFEHFNGEGTVFGSINKKDFQNLPVIEPQKPVLDAFEAITSGIDAQIENNELKLRTLTLLRDTLLPRLISGQLRLLEAEQAIAVITE